MNNDKTVSFVKYNLEELESAKNELSNLLAVIHADGGHYEAEHGIEKAVRDAKDKYLKISHELHDLNSPIPCSHLARYTYTPDEKESRLYCALCVLENYQEDVAEKHWLKQGKA